MRKLFLFIMVSLDGFFEGPEHDINWHHVDGEFGKFAIEQLDETDTILFGRRTYELMESFWPTKAGLEGDHETAVRMNTLRKVVFSKTLKGVEETENWKNVRLVKDNIAEEVNKLKAQPGKKMTVLGSSDLCVSLLKLGLLDELRIMVNPVVLGKGTKLFQGFDQKLNLTLTKSRTFKNGNVLLYYQIAR